MYVIDHGNVLMSIIQHTIRRLTLRTNLFDPSAIDHSPIYIFTVICIVNTEQLCVACLKSNHFFLLNVYFDSSHPKKRVQSVKFGKK